MLPSGHSSRRMSAAGFVSRLEIIYQEINFGPELLATSSSFPGWETFSASFAYQMTVFDEANAKACLILSSCLNFEF